MKDISFDNVLSIMLNFCLLAIQLDVSSLGHLTNTILPILNFFKSTILLIFQNEFIYLKLQRNINFYEIHSCKLFLYLLSYTCSPQAKSLQKVIQKLLINFKSKSNTLKLTVGPKTKYMQLNTQPFDIFHLALQPFRKQEKNHPFFKLKMRKESLEVYPRKLFFQESERWRECIKKNKLLEALFDYWKRIWYYYVTKIKLEKQNDKSEGITQGRKINRLEPKFLQPTILLIL